MTDAAQKPNLGKFGSFGRGVTPEQAKDIEALGYGAVWVGGSPPAELDWVEPILEKTTTSEDVNAALRAAADGPLKGILAMSDEPLVSIDFKGNSHSSIVDTAYTKVMDGDFVKVVSWYDNEWGYSNRCVDLLQLLVKKGF